MSLQDFATFAVGRVSARSGVVIKELSVEEAREHVKVVDGNQKKVVEGFQGLTLKLGRVKVSLSEQFDKAEKLQVPEDQVEAATAALLEAVAEGGFDKGIEEALVRLNEVAAPKSATATEVPSDEDFEDLPEGDEELSAED